MAKANKSPFKFNIHNQEGARKNAHFFFPSILINRRKERPFIDQANTVHRMDFNKISMGKYIKKTRRRDGMNEGRERGRHSGGKGGTEEGTRGERRKKEREGKWLNL